MLGLLGYPFRFAANNPLATLGALALIFAANVIFQLACAGLGFDPLYKEEVSGLDDVQRFALRSMVAYLVESFVVALAAAPLLVAALRDLNVRERGFDAWDAVVVALTWAPLFVVRNALVVFGVLFFVRTSVELQYIAERGWRPESFYWADFVAPLAVLVLTFIYVRLWIAAPAALRDRSLGFASAWKITKRQVWRSMASAVVLGGLSWGLWVLYRRISSYLPEPPYVPSLQAAFDPLALMHIGLDALGTAALSIFNVCALAFAFAQMAANHEKGRR